MRDLIWVIIKTVIRFSFPTVQNISTDELFSCLNQTETENPIVLDTRTEQEYAVSHIYEAQLVTSEQTNIIDTNTLNLNTPIVTYCSIGYRSAVIAAKLQKAGYKNVYNLEGSIFKWVNEGKPVYQNRQIVRQVHPYNQFWGYLIPQELHSK